MRFGSLCRIASFLFGISERHSISYEEIPCVKKVSIKEEKTSSYIGNTVAGILLITHPIMTSTSRMITQLNKFYKKSCEKRNADQCADKSSFQVDKIVVKEI
eukprot:TRINITY_DN6752_c0_g1_i1.p1 TRINITY_DN6752_c0_g1~~TRINITY_DN6752_c0_g1_i1.p1  ORF type:complete len:102 (+),score=7.84 TRINITY_DN6752_c0_g1_i1:205-510(+)